ncbi:MAG TPA: magnesium transporter [Patescibacteria group bacterium]|nr:magnesium transporter [Patescibacteria group bacterium]
MKNAKKILIQSLPALILASTLSSLGGIGLTLVKPKLIVILPLVILFPALNDMIGDYGAILGSKFTTWLYRGSIPTHWYRSKKLKNLVKNVLLIALFYSFLISFLAISISSIQGFPLTFSLILKVTIVTVLTTLSLVILLSLTIFSLGIFFYKKGFDPDNILIPLATSIADFGALAIFGTLIYFFF